MRLVRFSAQRYRSIIQTERFQLGDLTVLVGPNNEGKSNILQALVTSMTALAGRQGRLDSRRNLARRRVWGSRIAGGYSWERDFPRSLQAANPTGTSIFDLDFELNEAEIRQFEVSVGSRLNGVLPIRLAFGDDGYTFAVRKQRHSKALSARRAAIEEFCRSRQFAVHTRGANKSGRPSSCGGDG